MDTSRMLPNSAMALDGPQLPNIPGKPPLLGSFYSLILILIPLLHTYRHGGDEEFMGIQEVGWIQ